MVVRINEWEVKMLGRHLGMGFSAFIFQPDDNRPYNEHYYHHRTHIAPVVKGECRGFKDDVHYRYIDDRHLKQHRKNYSPDKIQV